MVELLATNNDYPVRAFYIPQLSDSSNKFGEYRLLKRIDGVARIDTCKRVTFDPNDIIPETQGPNSLVHSEDFEQEQLGRPEKSTVHESTGKVSRISESDKLDLETVEKQRQIEEYERQQEAKMVG